MTAPLFNLPITAPITGAAAAGAAGQGALGGFEALLAAFFGGQGVEAAAGLFGEATGGNAEAASDKPAKSDLEDKTAPTDPLALAAMLVTTPAPVAAVAVAVAAADAAFGGGKTEAPAPADAAPAPAFAAPPLTADQAAANAEAKAAALAQAAADQTGLAAPTGDAAEVADLAHKLPGLPVDKVAEGPKPTHQPVKAQAPQAQPPAPQPQAQIAPAEAQQAPAAQQALALAEATAAEPEAEAETTSLQPHAAPRGTRHADAARKTGNDPAAAPVADDAVLPTAVAQAQGVESAAEPASALEAETVTAPAAREAKPDTTAADSPDFQLPLQASATAHAHASTAPHGPPVRATSETIANLTAQIGKKLEGRSTKFDVELTPAGLGQVNIAVEIAASGKMTAAMSFDTPQAAAELRARSHELQRALEQAGFDISGGLSFDVAGDQGRQAQQQQQQNDGAAWRGRAFQAVLGTAGEAAETAASAALQYARRSDTGVDIRI